MGHPIDDAGAEKPRGDRAKEQREQVKPEAPVQPERKQRQQSHRRKEDERIEWITVALPRDRTREKKQAHIEHREQVRRPRQGGPEDRVFFVKALQTSGVNAIPEIPRGGFHRPDPRFASLSGSRLIAIDEFVTEGDVSNSWVAIRQSSLEQFSMANSSHPEPPALARSRSDWVKCCEAAGKLGPGFMVRKIRFIS